MPRRILRGPVIAPRWDVGGRRVIAALAHFRPNSNGTGTVVSTEAFGASCALRPGWQGSAAMVGSPRDRLERLTG